MRITKTVRRLGASVVGLKSGRLSITLNMDTRYILIVVADCFGFVNPTCDKVLHRYKEEEHKPVDTERFIEFLRDKLCPIFGLYLVGEPHSVVVMDNCSIDTDSEVTRLIKAYGTRIVHSATYSPELITIENRLYHLKTYLRRFDDTFYDFDWYSVLSAAFRTITPQQGLRYFCNTNLVELGEDHPFSESFQLKLKIDVALSAAAVAAVYFMMKSTP